MTIRIINVFPWGVRALRIMDGSIVDYSREQIDELIEAGRIKGRLTKGTVLTVLPE